MSQNINIFKYNIKTFLKKNICFQYINELRLKLKNSFTYLNFIPNTINNNLPELIYVVNNNFNFNVNNANKLIPLAVIHGWNDIGGKAKLINIFHLSDFLKKSSEKKIVFISENLLCKLESNKHKIIKDHFSFVWVDIHPKKQNIFNQKHPLVKDFFSYGLKPYKMIADIEPTAIYAQVDIEDNYYYDDWVSDGFKLISFYPSADNYLYSFNYDKNYAHFMSYIGGYWEEKGINLDMMFRDFEDKFYPYGFNIWPYKNYQGSISIANECKVYSSSKIIPIIHSPQGIEKKELTDRYFKPFLCNAFCLIDSNPAFPKIFSNRDFLIFDNKEHFNFLVNEVINDRIDIEHWKMKSANAILKNHLPKHRANQILNIILKNE